MSAGINGNSAETSNASPATAGDRGDYSAALASIGAAIGELRDSIGPSMEKAFTDAIASDSTNNAIYDAVASATYDAVGDLQADGKIGGVQTNEQGNPGSDADADMLASLLKVDTKSDIDRLGETLGASIDDIAGKVQTDGLLKTLGDGVRSIKDEISGGNDADDADGAEPNQVVPLTAIESQDYDESGVEGENGEIGHLLNTVDDINVNVMLASQNSAEMLESVSSNVAGFRDDAEQHSVSVSDALGSISSTVERIESNTAGTTPGNDKEKRGPSDASDAKRNNDLMTDLMSNTIPAYMEKGNEVFDMILDDGITVQLDEASKFDVKGLGDDIGNNVSSAVQKFPLGSILKAGGFAALAAGTVASIAAIGTAAKGIFELVSSNRESERRIREMTENARKANEERKRGANDNLRDATQGSIEADNELAIEENSFFGGLGEKLFGANSARGKARAKARSAAGDLAIAKRRYDKKREAAKAYGVDPNNLEAFTKWENEQKELAKKSGVDMSDEGKFIRFITEGAERHKKELEAGTQPNDSGKPVTAEQPSNTANAADANPSNTGPEQGGPAAIPLAAGANENNTTTTVNAGEGVMTQDVVTAETQFQQYRQYTFEGIRDALLLPEVQTMFSNTARSAGSAVEQELMG